MAKVTAKCLVDTNVPIIANESLVISKIPDDRLGCVLACVEKVQAIMNGKVSLVLDAKDEIYDEYRRKLSLSGRDGIGDAFMKWVHDNRWASCELVEITKSGTSYAEFPSAAALNAFDASDKKFVAVANAHTQKPPIAVAIERGWWNHKKPLKDAGINVDFLCPTQIEQASTKKQKKSS